MSVTERALTVGLFLLTLAPAVGGLWTLLVRNYIIGGRSFDRLERVYIHPSSKLGLFIIVVGIHLFATFILCFLIFSVLHDT